MKLSQYPRPKDDTGLGIHGSANIFYPLGERNTDYPYWVSELKQMGFKWYKLAVGGDAGGEAIAALVNGGIMPVVRMYRPEPNPGTMVDDDPKGKEWVKKYIAQGARYIEVNNEPNLLTEWKNGWGSSDADPTEWKKGNQPQRVAQSWVKDAEYVMQAGGLPALPALSPGGHYNDVDFFRLMLAWLKEHNYQDLLAQGCWIAVHNGTLNHPLDYPADDVNQKGTPVTQADFGRYQWAGDINYVNGERSRGKNPGQTLVSVNAEGRDTGGSNCWLKFQAYHDIFVQTFGFEIPVLGTEGGVWCDVLADPRYPKITADMQRDWTLEICRKMMANQYPDYYFCTGFWLIANHVMGAATANGFENDAWYSFWRTETGGRLPVVDALKALPKQVRRAPADALPPPATAGASRIYGTVTDQRKAPAAGVVVGLSSNVVGGQTLQAGSTGSYEFKSLPAGVYTVAAADASKNIQADGKAAYQADLVVSAATAFKYAVARSRALNREDGPCACTDGRGVYGRITGADGRPLSDVRVRVAWDGGSAEVTSASATSKDPGRYEYAAPAGELTVSVVQGDWPSDAVSGLRTDWVPDHCYGKVVHEVNFQLTSQLAKGATTVYGAVAAGPGGSGEPAGLVPPVPPKLGHYMLFGKPNTARARQELRAAVEYVAKAGATLGFSLDEAAGAQLVTIVGGTDVVSEEAEQSLRNLGHDVQRIGGDRAAILDALEEMGAKRVLRGGKAGSAAGAEIEAEAHPTGKAGVIIASTAPLSQPRRPDVAAKPARARKGAKKTG